MLLDLLGFGLVMPFLALQARETFGVEASTAALLGTTYSAAQFLFMPLWGRLSDRVGRRPVMLVSIMASALSMAGLGFSLGFTDVVLWLFVTRALGGMATANIGTASAYIADITTPEERVKGMGLIGMAFGIGFIIGPGVGGLLAGIEINGREGPVACFVAGALSLVNFVWAYFALPESLPKERRALASRAPLAPGRLQAGAAGSPASRRQPSPTSSSSWPSRGSRTPTRCTPRICSCSRRARWGCCSCSWASWARMVQGVFMRRASGRYRETSLAYVGLTLMTSGFAGFVMAPALGIWFLLVASACLAIGNGFTQPSISAYISRLADPARQGETLSGNQSLASLGRVFGPLVAGQLYTFSPRVPFAGCALINLLALGVGLGMRSIQPRASSVPATALES